jgi:hypothetical protein
MRAIIFAAAAALVCCGGTRSAFELTTTGDVAVHVSSDAGVRGAVDNAGQLMLDDGTWAVSMTLTTLSADGWHPTSTFTLVHRGQDVFSTSNGGSCKAMLDPHGATNGDAVHGYFACTGLVSNVGETIDITYGELSTAIGDVANDPTLNPPPAP